MEDFIQKIPMVMLRGVTVLPHTTVHFDVGREQSAQAVKAALKRDQRIYLVAQKDSMEDQPDKSGLYKYGVLAKIIQILDRKEGLIRVLVEATDRAEWTFIDFDEQGKYYTADIQAAPYNEVDIHSEEMTAVMRLTADSFINYCELLPKQPAEAAQKAVFEKDPYKMFGIITSIVMLEQSDKQKLLEQEDIYEQLVCLNLFIRKEAEILGIQREIVTDVRNNLETRNREVFIREQIRVLQQELSDGGASPDTMDEESAALYDSIVKIKNMPDETREKLLGEVEKFSKVVNFPQEASVIRTYLETCIALPWDNVTQDKIDIAKAKKQLDKDHYGLEDVKDRILELLSVRKLAPDIKGQIICLVGPPGIGKTSIGQSIAKTMGRNYSRVSLGGVRDEADIRGHRKTYIGAMPGRIINAVLEAKTRNPLILLDEIDKMSNDFRGDPASAMLEVLDSAQNSTFRDHYLEIPFDLSDVLFVATANNLSSVPAPLRDRMEIIELTSYTREEKFNIAKKHLLPKQLERHGLTSKNCIINNAALYDIIDSYTKEAGVRTLERTIAKVCRRAAKKIVSKEEEKVSVTSKNIEEILGPKIFLESDYDREDRVGVVNGLAWTSVGGELLEIEVAKMKGDGKIKLTGSLGDVMKESAQIAVSYVRSISDQYGIDSEFYKNYDVHIHAPEGAVPKDGPSAGVTMVTGLVSALSGRKVKNSVAMTGEISLTGRVLPIGGLKEKSMAAFKAGKKTVIIPKGNKSDLAKIDEKVLENIEFVPVDNVKQVLDTALCE